MINSLKQQIRLLANARKEPYLLFRKLLGFYPNDIKLYQLALLAKNSFVRDENGTLINNERLEFLGDAVLETAVTDILYRHFADKSEGFLTILRAKVVQRKSLNRIGMQLELNRLMKAVTNAKSFNIYGNTLEALIGAVYLDKGYDYCRLFVENKIILKHINLEKLAETETNYKAKLLEWGQKNKMLVRWEWVEGLSKNNKKFQSEVYVENLKAGFGEAYSKKDAQLISSEMAYKKLNGAFLDEIKKAKQQRMSAPAIEENI